MEKINADRGLYIKQGGGGRWDNLAITTGTLRLGFSEISHSAAMLAVPSGDFTFVRDHYLKNGVARGAATRYSNEVREFYTAGSDVLWITFSQRRLWWCLADPQVIATDGQDQISVGSRYRKTVNGWSDKNLHGETLWITNLRGSLTTTAGFRGTICRVSEFEYLLRRLNGEETSDTLAVRRGREALIVAVAKLIRGLHWRDFELLVELVMTQGGLRRLSVTGEEQYAIDLELELPLTHERTVVQIKSKLDATTAKKLAEALTAMATNAKVFIAYHSGPDMIEVEYENVTMLGANELSERVVDLGLTQWVMNKVS